MRRIILLVALAFIVSGGAVLTAAESETNSRTEETEIGAQALECATPMVGLEGTPAVDEAEELLATAIASPELIADLATAIASHDASPVVPADPCATPNAATPAS